MSITDDTIDQLHQELRCDNPWAWDMPRNGCARMTDSGAALERLLVLREWLESGGYLVVPERRPERWAQVDEIEDWIRDTRSDEQLEELEATYHETGDPWVTQLAEMPVADAIAAVDSRLERYVELFEDMRFAAEQD